MQYQSDVGVELTNTTEKTYYYDFILHLYFKETDVFLTACSKRGEKSFSKPIPAKQFTATFEQLQLHAKTILNRFSCVEEYTIQNQPFSTFKKVIQA